MQLLGYWFKSLLGTIKNPLLKMVATFSKSEVPSVRLTARDISAAITSNLRVSNASAMSFFDDLVFIAGASLRLHLPMARRQLSVPVLCSL